MTRPRTMQRRPAAPSLLDAITAVQRAAGDIDLAPPIASVDLENARDARGYRRTIATTSEFHVGREPLNKGQTYPPDPPSVAECMNMLKACAPDPFGRRLFAGMMLMWQGALRAFEALAITEADLDERTGRLQVRHGKGDKQATISMAEWAWPFLEEWRALRVDLPNPAGPLLCVIDGQTAGRAWAYSDLNRSLKKIARAAGVTKRMSPHQLRHGWAAHAYDAKLDLRSIQLHLRHENIGITDTYLRGLGLDQSREQVFALAVPTVPATALLELTAPKELAHAG